MFSHQEVDEVYRRNKLKGRRDLYWRFACAFLVWGLVFGSSGLYAGLIGGMVFGLIFWGTTRGMDRHIAAYDRQQAAIVSDIWQD